MVSGKGENLEESWYEIKEKRNEISSNWGQVKIMEILLGLLLSWWAKSLLGTSNSLKLFKPALSTVEMYWQKDVCTFRNSLL